VITLIQIPFSHNCVKVRRALELKRLGFATRDIAPMNREPVFAASGQRLVPAIVDDGRAVSESTAILHYLEAIYPEPSLLPDDRALHADCWLVEDWADSAFMQMSRRMAYWQTITTPGFIEALWFPEARGLKRLLLARTARRVLSKRFKLSTSRNARDEAETPRVTRLALDRLGGRPYLFGDRVTVADVALAAMSAPLRVAAAPIREHADVRSLLDWGATILGPELETLYALPPGKTPRVGGAVGQEA